MPIAGHNVLKQICDALGLQGRAVRRIVLDVAVNDVVKLYVEELPSKQEAEALAEVLPSLTVDVTSVECVKVFPQAGVFVRHHPSKELGG